MKNDDWKLEKRGWRWRLARLRGHGSLITGVTIVALYCIVAVFAELLAPYDYRSQSRKETYTPPSIIRFRDQQGRWSLRPFIYARRLVDNTTQRYEEITDRAYPLELFVRGYSYDFLWLFPTRAHLFGVRSFPDAESPRVYLLGTDKYGRDRFSRLLIATQYSLLVGPTAALLASALGILIGVIAGYLGGLTDAVLMRAADTMLALPALVLILAVRATFPPGLSLWSAIMLLLTIFVALGWAELARLARSLTLELRERDHVLAAVSLGCSTGRVIVRHILLNAAGPLVTEALLILPVFLLAETALSYLGVGLQDPDASLGGLLTAIDSRLFKRGQIFAELSPAFAITVFVLGVRLLGDGVEKARRDSEGSQEYALHMKSK